MSENRRRIDRLLADDYVGGLPEVPLGTLREMRRECLEEEALLSYERRLLHGRIALLRAELARRAGGEHTSLVDLLPQILGDEIRGPGRGAFAGLDPHVEFQIPHRRVSKMVSDDTLAKLPDLEEDEITRFLVELERTESEVSSTRRPLLDVMDRLNKELARRYAIGEATPDDVLTES